MHNYLAIIFRDTTSAYEGLHELWQLDALGDITVHGATVVHRDPLGQIRVDTKETFPALATAVGVGVGALLGLIAGPAGIAIGAATGAAIGATAGGVVGAMTDLNRADVREQAFHEAVFGLAIGQSAIIADVSEDELVVIDVKMKKLGGTVHRRARREIERDGLLSQSEHLYPYEYVPRDASFW